MDKRYEARIDQRLGRLMVAARGRSLTGDDLMVTILSRDCYTPVTGEGIARLAEHDSEDASRIYSELKAGEEREWNI